MYTIYVHVGVFVMQQVNVTEFRHHLFEFINNVSNEPLELISRGQVVARLLPPEDPKASALEFLKKLRKTAVMTQESDLSLRAFDSSDWSEDKDDSIGY